MTTKVRKITPRENPWSMPAMPVAQLPTLTLRCEELPKIDGEWQADKEYCLELTTRVSNINCPSNGSIKDVTFEIKKVAVDDDEEEQEVDTD